MKDASLILTKKAMFFGGPYGNYQAVVALRNWADLNKIPSTQIICTGDTVAYCAAPEKTVSFIRDWGIKVIAGNVELQLANSLDDCGCNFLKGSTCDLLSNIWYANLKNSLSESSIDWMKTLPTHLKYEMGGKKITVVHGTKRNPSKFIFNSTPWQIKKEEILFNNSDVIVAGHCGLPFCEIRDELCWVNPGVIGMPANDGTSRVWFSCFEELSNAIHINIRPLTFDYLTASEEIEKNFLPTEYAQTLRTGLWNSCDILPELEHLKKGIELDNIDYYF